MQKDGLIGDTMIHTNQKKEQAVSPVVGVMLMLVVTIIIAAVVASFAGGFAGTQEKSPTIVAQTEIWSGGTSTSFSSGRFQMTIESISEPVSTSDLELRTSWVGTDGETYGEITTAGMMNTKYTSGSYDYEYNSPIGYGPGIAEQVNSGQYKEDQYFGNYILQGGRTMASSGSGVGASHIEGDALDGILGAGWDTLLTPGMIVNVKLIHIPSNSVIYDKNVVVQ